MHLTRRKFLKGAAVTTAGLVAAGRLELLRFPDVFAGFSPLTSDPHLSVSFVRPDDLAALKFDFINFTFQPGDVNAKPPKDAELIVGPPISPTYIVMHLPPQNIAEQAFFESSPKADPNKVLGPNGLPVDSSNVGFEKHATSDDLPSPPGSVLSRLAGWSRVVFIVPPSITSITYTLHAILDAITKCDLSVAPNALPLVLFPPDVLPPIGLPDSLTTAIESPYRLIISPHMYARWAHSPAPVDHGSPFTELWHSRLAVVDSNGNPDERDLIDIYGHPRTIRAIWSPDYLDDGSPNQKPTPVSHNPYNPLESGPTHYVEDNPNSNGPPFFRTSLDNRDRDEIVHLSANFRTMFIDRKYVPPPIPVNRLMLSSLGAWMDLDGLWDPFTSPPNLSIEEWRHIAGMGRDQYVKVVYAGHLLPFGHRASLIKVTERKLIKTAVGEFGAVETIVAYLKQRMYIIVREPEKGYPAIGQPWNGRRTPFRNVRITTLVTPNLSDPTGPSSAIGTGHGQDAFWVQVNDNNNNPTDFQFHFVATDWDGNVSEFHLPMAFADTSLSDNDYKDVVNGYDTDTSGRRVCSLAGQAVAFAPTANLPLKNNNLPNGKTTYNTDDITWTAEYFDSNKINKQNQTTPPPIPSSSQQLLDAKQAPFYPAAESIHVRISAIAQLANTDVGSTEIQFHGDVNKGYLWNAFDQTSNSALIFAELTNPPNLDLGADSHKSGGLATPSMTISGLSAALGTVGNSMGSSGLDNLANGNFDPTQVLLDSAKILGAIRLSDIIESLSGIVPDHFGDGKASPKITTTLLPNSAAPTEISVNLHWEPTENDGVTPAILQAWDPFKSSVQRSDSPPPLFQGNAKLTIDATITKPLTSGDPTYNIMAIIEPFDNNIEYAFAINLLPGERGPLTLITVPINRLEFHSASGGKTDVSAVLGSIQFEGILSFVQTLENILSSLGFDDPPFLDVNASGITAGFSIGIPEVPIGALILNNLKLLAKLHLPFIGESARLRFEISEREDPFTLTYTVFGGGGFFGLALGLDGIEVLEGSLEFGAYLSLDLGVASGGAHAAAGIYFKMEQDPDPSNQSHEKDELSGYVRIGGSLEVLGVVTLSTEFYLSLTYDTPPPIVTGQASLTVEVDLPLLPPASVTLGPITKTFGHSPPPPTFGDAVPSDSIWEKYISKFADSVT